VQRGRRVNVDQTQNLALILIVLSLVIYVVARRHR
jgi:hypothetical protein